MTPYRRAASSGAACWPSPGAVASIGVGSLLVSAADHLDAPTTKPNHRIDITDLYAFKSSGGTTLVLNVNPLTSPGRQPRPLRFSTERASTSSTSTSTWTAWVDVVYRVKFGNTHSLGRRRDRPGLLRQAIDRGIAPGSTPSSARRWRTATTTAYKPSPRGSPRSPAAGERSRGPGRSVLLRPAGLHRRSSRELLKGTTDLGDPDSVASPAPTPSPGPTSPRSSIEVPNAQLGGTGRTVGVWGTTLAGQRRRHLQAGRADGPPGDQYGLQQHARRRRKRPTGCVRPTTWHSTVTTSSPS